MDPTHLWQMVADWSLFAGAVAALAAVIAWFRLRALGR